MKIRTRSGAALCAALLAPTLCLAEGSRGAPGHADVEKQLQELKQMRQDLSEQSKAFDQRIYQLETELYGEDAASRSTPMPGVSKGYRPGKGFNLFSSDQGEVNFGVFSYVRYLNQQDFDDSYTDSFGNSKDMDIRNDVQFQKVNISFKGWIFDPKFHYLFYTWTSNTSQGDPAQVVVGGNLGYTFSKALTVYGGIGALPTTRTTNNTFPNWLKNDHRSIADEYFRGSYTSGFWAEGELAPGVQYRAMIGNNLSQLGVDGAQLDDGFNTVAAALWWMPTTGEFGPGEGFGDYEFHEQMATRLGLHFTHSREDAQAQPGTNTFENSQIRLSDGTLIFSADPFGNGTQINRATYQMAAANAGLKYRGWYLEAEFYQRWVDNFSANGPLPVDELNDKGFQVQGSHMVIPKTLQAYLEYSKINGEYGNPCDVSVGINWFPFKRKEMRVEVQGLYLKDSPVGYSSVPFSVGANGWAFTTDFVLAF
ncbi:hypothetical protein A11A3_08245 [Alcanivorax hongdengensis A-11-3]|uniref:Phosphate-selective porin O and P n=1 Tax=Alcanivorax hongdengensis A-11-3 TaxID=1177179 RepID=L0WEL7_9GAMM|nr:hypothetical protein [Alcanivorax hongdengensis]EKF74602.1 hypothetical protein A11A3_08245 [Alcanivorax hongdengensis A-11-3]